MSDRHLAKLAKLVYTMTKRDKWVCGRYTDVDGCYADGWPHHVWLPDIGKGEFWALSPEVIVGDNAVRVGIMSHTATRGYEHVQRYEYTRICVFVDDALAWPGGEYYVSVYCWWWPFNGNNWAKRFLKEIKRAPTPQMIDQDARKLLINQAIAQKEGRALPAPMAVSDPLYKQALAELEAELEAVG